MTVISNQIIDLNNEFKSSDNLTFVIEPHTAVTLRYCSDPALQHQTITRSIHCIVSEHASLTFECDESWDDTITATTNITIEQKASSSVYYVHRVKGGARIKQTLKIIAQGDHAESRIRGKYELTGNGRAEMITLQYHDAAHTRSDLLFKSIVRDKAHAIHHGTIEITKRGAHTESAQHTHTLLLSDHARAYSVPNIEVARHDVLCGHGSAIGRLDEERIWYLQSRGLSRKQAEGILIEGFLHDVL